MSTTPLQVLFCEFKGSLRMIGALCSAMSADRTLKILNDLMASIDDDILQPKHSRPSAPVAPIFFVEDRKLIKARFRKESSSCRGGRSPRHRGDPRQGRSCSGSHHSAIISSITVPRSPPSPACRYHDGADLHSHSPFVPRYRNKMGAEQGRAVYVHDNGARPPRQPRPAAH